MSMSNLNRLETGASSFIRWCTRVPLIALSLVVLYYLGNLFAWAASILFG